MQGTIASNEFAASKAHLCGEHPVLDEVVDIMEWELLACDVPDQRYPLLAKTKANSVHYFATNRSSRAPACVVVFSFEVADHERKVLLMDVKLVEEEDCPF